MKRWQMLSSDTSVCVTSQADLAAMVCSGTGVESWEKTRVWNYQLRIVSTRCMVPADPLVEV